MCPLLSHVYVASSFGRCAHPGLPRLTNNVSTAGSIRRTAEHPCHERGAHRPAIPDSQPLRTTAMTCRFVQPCVGGGLQQNMRKPRTEAQLRQCTAFAHPGSRHIMHNATRKRVDPVGHQDSPVRRVASDTSSKLKSQCARFRSPCSGACLVRMFLATDAAHRCTPTSSASPRNAAAPSPAKITNAFAVYAYHTNQRRPHSSTDVLVTTSTT